MALSHRPSPLVVQEDNRFEKGPASGTPEDAPEGAWPCYRGDAARKGATASALSDTIKENWTTEIGRGLTAPVIGGGKVVLAAGEEHRVVALDAANGRQLWNFSAGGRIDSPPTISGSLVIFGCRDGWLYALNATSGEPVWRYRVAPAEERVIVDGQLESAWPLHGSVVVVKDVVFCAAGWHTAMDGGVTIVALRAVRGEVLWTRRLEESPDAVTSGHPVALLSSDGQELHMGRRAFDLATGEDAKGWSSVVSFGVSSFRDNDWTQFSNHKGRLHWRYENSMGELLSVGDSITCGLSVGFRTGDDGPMIGANRYSLFGIPGGKDKEWKKSVPLIPRAMVLAGATLFVAGIPDPVIPELIDIKDHRQKAKIVAEWPEEKLVREGGELLVLSAMDGKSLRSMDLGSTPVFDGMAAADGRLYVSCKDGKLRSFGAE